MAGKPLSICHLGKFYPPAPGGIETHVQTLARAQAALGATVKVICINHANRAGRDVTWARYGATRTVEERRFRALLLLEGTAHESDTRHCLRSIAG